MKLGRVRIGERFVFDDIGGVYTKLSSGVAKCVYGPNFGKEVEINKDMSVYVILNEQGLKKLNSKDNIKIVLMDKNEKEIEVIEDATPKQISVYSHVDCIKRDGKNIHSIEETIMDSKNNTLYVVISE